MVGNCLQKKIDLYGKKVDSTHRGIAYGFPVLFYGIFWFRCKYNASIALVFGSNFNDIYIIYMFFVVSSMYAHMTDGRHFP